MKKIKIEDFSQFKNLFMQFKQEELDILFPYIRKVKAKTGEFLFYEGSTAGDIYLIEKGEIALLKEGKQFSVLKKGDIAGKISLLTQAPRLASAKIISPTELIHIQITSLKKEHFKIGEKLLNALSKIIPKNLFSDIELKSKELNQEISLLKENAIYSELIIYILTLISLFLLHRLFFNPLEAQLETHLITDVKFLIIALLIYIYLSKKGFSYKQFGCNLNNIKKSLGESFVATFLIIASYTITKFFLINNFKIFQNNILFLKDFFNYKMILGYFVFIPIQEIFIRGYLQKILKKLIMGKYSYLQAIIISNILILSFYSFLDLSALLIYFILGLIWGVLYERHDSLLGVTLSHIFVSIYIVNVIGIIKVS